MELSCPCFRLGFEQVVVNNVFPFLSSFIWKQEYKLVCPDSCWIRMAFLCKVFLLSVFPDFIQSMEGEGGKKRNQLPSLSTTNSQFSFSEVENDW